ncbi:cytochrome P450 [Paraconexibacter antarcticus]|uniref:Cytochrome P450 n=1 Tax=Paraconexibacter antarcticus TaxID=2949664 RepID=A0ABY5DTF9_9ACTN|nr:cytochrome P450 [Paraconexibacter antarcticus]UTI63834.1 cytochrome P450 [Paraconexibacter antarcticus]
MTTTAARTPSLDSLPVAWDMLTRGLHVDGPLVTGAPGSDIVTVRIGRRRQFILRHPDYVDHVLHEGADGYHKSIEYELLRAVLGLNLFTDEDESWRRHRMMLNPTMSKRHVRGMVDLMIDPIERFVADIGDGSGPVRVDMSGDMVALTIDVVGTALFGHAFGEIGRRMKRVVTTGLRSAEVATRLLMVFAPPVWGLRAFAGAIHRAPYLPPPLAPLQWVMKTVDETVWALIDDRRAHPTDTDDLLNLLLTVRDDEGRPLPLRRVRDEVTTFMLAGHETTANALAWMWYLLALNPDARDRMLAEVDEVLGDGHRPTTADIARLEWTTACFQEAMRFYPPAWVIPRTATRDDVIDGHRIPKGSTVLIPIHAIHHDDRFWAAPETYDPSRFLGDAPKGRHRSAYLPFGGGRRVCIGTSFALMEATLITAMMSRDFVYDLVPGHPVEPEATLTLRARYGVKMVAKPRPGARLRRDEDIS